MTTISEPINILSGEAKFRALFEQCPIGISLVSFNRHFMEVNESFLEIFGYSHEELLGLTINDVTHPEDIPKEIPLIEALLRNEIHSYSCEKRVFRKTGEIAFVNVTVTAIRDDEGRPVFGIGMVHDLTQRKLAEEAARISEKRFRDLYQNLLDGVAEVDRAGRIVHCNPRFLCMLGYDNDEIRQLTYQDITPRRWHEKESRILHETVDVRGYSDLYEKEYTHKNGTVFPVEVQTYALRDEAGHSTGYWAFVRDVSERKNAENALRKSVEEKEILLREIHHRVKNNLAITQSLLRLQSRRSENKEFKEMVEAGEQRIHSMAIAHELLYRSDNLSTISTSEYLTQLLHHLTVSLAGIGSKVQIESDIEIVELGIDKIIPLGSIVSELVTNCLKHAFPDNSSGKVVVKLQEEDETKLILSVTDNGIGFSVLDAERKSIGLDLVNIFVGQLNGNLQISANNGTCARIEFEVK